LFIRRYLTYHLEHIGKIDELLHPHLLIYYISFARAFSTLESTITPERQLKKSFYDEVEKERRFKENQLQLAKSAIRDIQLGNRRFCELSLEEISALQGNDSYWREAMKQLEASKGLEEKAKQSLDTAIEQLQQIFGPKLGVEREENKEEQKDEA
jgi:hypothetical protein